jgi:DNA repair ATPase RecN
MVLAPQEYKGPDMTKEEIYRKYFLYWKSWHDELISSLSPGANHKKQIDCVEQAIKNLEHLKGLLSEEKQKKLDIYITQLNSLMDLITKDTYGTNIVSNRTTAERIKRNILRDFPYNKIKHYLA